MKQIIILEQVKRDGGPIELRYALWAAVPAARQTFYANAGFETAFKNASAQEITDLRNGAVTEKVATGSWPAGTTNAAIRTALEAIWAAFNTEVQNFNPWNRYGSFWDGTNWTGAGVS